MNLPSIINILTIMINRIKIYHIHGTLIIYQLIKAKGKGNDAC